MRASLAFVLALSAAACASTESPPIAPPPAEPPVTTQPSDPPAPAATGPQLETVPCRFLAPRSVEGQTFYCADLSVPENRRNPGSGKIKLHVAVMKGKPGGVPTLELVGGPGGSSDPLVGGVAAKRVKIMEAYGRFLEQGDIVFFDQRGTGRSVPRLSCGQDEEPSVCLERLKGAGIDVVAYDTIENADDVHDLKVALGVAKVDLHGISYGTRLGIEVLKRHPDDVRAAILDGVMPSDVSVLGGFEIAMDGVLTKVFGACAADTKCNAAYPDLDATLGKLKTKLETTPFKGKDPDFGKFDYDWQAFNADLVEEAYGEGNAARWPYKLHALLEQTQAQWDAERAAEAKAVEASYVEEDEADAANPLSEEFRNLERKAGDEDYAASDMANGMYLSVTCNDYTQHESVGAAIAAVAKIRPELRDELSIKDEFDSCKDWPKRASDPTLRDVPKFTGPVLVIGGALDTATPADWARHVSESLPNDQLVVVPTGGHGLMDACGAGLKGAFLGDPTAPISAACATDRSLQFYYPKTQHSRRPTANARVLMPLARTPMARVADRVLAAAIPSFGLSTDILRRKIALHRR